MYKKIYLPLIFLITYVISLHGMEPQRSQFDLLNELSILIAQKRLPEIRELLPRITINLLLPLTTGETVLHTAAQTGDVDIFNILLDAIRAHQKIQCAATNNHFKLFLSPRDGKDQTPIMLAHKNGHTILVKLMLSQGYGVILQEELSRVGGYAEDSELKKALLNAEKNKTPPAPEDKRTGSATKKSVRFFAEKNDDDIQVQPEAPGSSPLQELPMQRMPLSPEHILIYRQYIIPLLFLMIILVTWPTS
jgi:hypothetical protein